MILLTPDEIRAACNGLLPLYAEEINKAAVRKAMEWGDGVCPHISRGSYTFRLRRECGLCWEELRREEGLE